MLIDLDGVLNEYTGNYIENFIPPIKYGAFEFLQKISKDYKVKLFTTRDKKLAKEWLNKYNLSEIVKDVTNIKEPAYITIDDRCIKFDGDYSKLYKDISDFKVWYKN